jgi:hypothetical protein
MTREKTIVIPKKALQIGLLSIIVLIAVVLAAPLLKSTPSDSGDPSDTAAAVASAGTPGSSTDLEQQDVDIDAALDAAVHAVHEVMWFDYTEGQDAWALRIDAISTPNGMAFWNGPFFADQSWPMIMEREYVTQDIEVSDAHIVGEGTVPGSVIIQVSTKTTYITTGTAQPEQAENTNKIVMVYTEDGQWLNDGPPLPHSND